MIENRAPSATKADLIRILGKKAAEETQKEILDLFKEGIKSETSSVVLRSEAVRLILGKNRLVFNHYGLWPYVTRLWLRWRAEETKGCCEK